MSMEAQQLQNMDTLFGISSNSSSTTTNPLTSLETLLAGSNAAESQSSTSAASSSSSSSTATSTPAQQMTERRRIHRRRRFRRCWAPAPRPAEPTPCSACWDNPAVSRRAPLTPGRPRIERGGERLTRGVVPRKTRQTGPPILKVAAARASCTCTAAGNATPQLQRAPADHRDARRTDGTPLGDQSARSVDAALAVARRLALHPVPRAPASGGLADHLRADARPSR